MIERIIIAGAGGQGIMLVGKVLAQSAMLEDKQVTWMPCYGPEVRGGAAYCMLVISDEEIGSPMVRQADSMIIMNQLSLDKFKPRLAKNGLLVLNSSLADANGALKHPFTDIAIEMGNIKVANMIALGCFLARKKIVVLKTVVEAMKKIAPPGQEELITINRQALYKGAELK